MKTKWSVRLACAALACILGIMLAVPGLAEDVSSAPVEPAAEEQPFELFGEDAPVEANDGETTTPTVVDPGVFIDPVNFPDSNFRTWVLAYCDVDGNNYLSAAEAAKHTSIDLSGRGIATLTGIEHFTALTTLSCANNSITTVRLTNPLLTSLDCSNNGLLYVLDLSSNPRLRSLNCANCMLSSIIFGSASALEELHCQKNLIRSLDLTKLIFLETLECQDNEITELSILSCPALIELCDPVYEIPSSNYCIYMDGDNILSFDLGVRFSLLPEVLLYGKTSYTAEVGQPFQIVLMDGVYAEKFSSANRKVAKVDRETGVVEPTGEGKTKITCKTTSDAKLTLSLKVKDPTMPTGISLEEGTIVVEIQETDREIEYELEPDTAVSEVTWQSSSTLVAKVKDGLIIPRNEGKTTITATTKRGKKHARVKVEVIDGAAAESVTIDSEDPLQLYIGETMPLTATIEAKGDYEPESYLKWSSSNKKVATVGRHDGIVTAKKSGSAKITVETKNGKKDSIHVRVH